MEFLSLSRRRSFSRNVPSGKERGETDVFAGYSRKRYVPEFASSRVREVRARKSVTQMFVNKYGVRDAKSNWEVKVGVHKRRWTKPRKIMRWKVSSCKSAMFWRRKGVGQYDVWTWSVVGRWTKSCRDGDVSRGFEIVLFLSATHTTEKCCWQKNICPGKLTLHPVQLWANKYCAHR